MSEPTFRDVEILSAYLDDQLPAKDRAALETRLAGDPELRSVYGQLSQSRALLRSLPQRRAPRNFTLSPQKAGVKPPLPKLFPTFKFASVFASLLLMFGLATNSLFPAMQAARLAASDTFVYGMGGSPEIDLPVGGGMDERPQGGGGSDPEMEAAAPAMAEEAPMDSTTAQAVEPEESLKSVPPENAAPDASLAQEPQGMPTVEPPIPSLALGFVLAVAVVSGLAAYGSRWLNDRRWQNKR